MLKNTLRQLLGLRSDEIGRRSQDICMGDRLPIVMVNQGYWDGSESGFSVSDLASDPRYSKGLHRVFLTLDGAVVEPLLECDGDDSRLRALLSGGGVELWQKREALIAAGEATDAIGCFLEPRLHGVSALVGSKLVLLSDHSGVLGKCQGDSILPRAEFERALAAAIVTRKAQWAKARANAVSRGHDPDMLGG